MLTSRTIMVMVVVANRYVAYMFTFTVACMRRRRVVV
jgi:hypothetical protein